jgi:hypothetical protein
LNRIVLMYHISTFIMKLDCVFFIFIVYAFILNILNFVFVVMLMVFFGLNLYSTTDVEDNKVSLTD